MSLSASSASSRFASSATVCRLVCSIVLSRPCWTDYNVLSILLSLRVAGERGASKGIIGAEVAGWGKEARVEGGPLPNSRESVVLAYSGGLDTTVAIRWLQENYNMDVIALTVDIGGGLDLDDVRQRGLKAGAKKAIAVDAREEFVRDYVFPALQANAIYEGKYPLATALGRPLIASHLVKVALAEGATAIAHGCTGKGNDQVRFDVTTMALAPHLKV
ncbi:MAG: argininosuccinate synthase, partial [Chloroflexi bacterium]|nr:argininosuccinate synthase [Chloroflexota bacterium]